ncbi:MAG: hypothetical protein ACJ765_07950, partial [Chloroflexota bacterium]
SGRPPWRDRVPGLRQPAGPAMRDGGSLVSRRDLVLQALFVFAAALVVRILAASIVVFPEPEDTAYYVGIAKNMLEGAGLTTNAIWSYQTPPLSFPRPAFEVWLPLPTFLAAVPMAILGTTFAAAQWSSVVVGSLVPVLAWRIAADAAIDRRLPISRVRVLAVGTGLTGAVYLPLVLHSALPDSTMPFAVLALAACALMPRLLREAESIRLIDWRLVGLGVLIGVAALTRNEAAFVGFAWLVVVWLRPGISGRRKLSLVAAPAIVALVVFTPWMLRDWVEFGNPLPGQALANALSVTGFDIFAWEDPPTLARYLSVGPARLLEMRVEGVYHNLFTVLLIPGFPTSFLGLVALPWFIRLRALAPLAVLSVTTFLVTSLVFPVSTTWGTYLHAAGPAHVLLIVSALLALDSFIAWVGQRRGWTRPVAWLGAALTVSASLLFLAAPSGMPFVGGQSEAFASRYRAIDVAMAAAARPLAEEGPIITNFPIWLAVSTGAKALALPNESPRAVADLARQFQSRLLVVVGKQHGDWPGVLETDDPGAECFHELHVPPPADPREAGALEEVRVFEVVCP